MSVFICAKWTRRPQQSASLSEAKGERCEGRAARNFRQEIYL